MLGPIPVAKRVGRFSYAIRNIVSEARAVEALGKRVRYLNIGDPVAFGYQPPPHLIEAAERAMHDGYNGYLPSAGILEARQAVAEEYQGRGVAVSPDRVLITTGTGEGIELAINALVDEGDEVLVPTPTYPLYTAILAKLNARPVYYRTDPANEWLPDIEHLRTLVTPKTKALVVIDPNNPTGAVYPASTRRRLIEVAEEFGLTILADEVYGDLGFDGPVPPLATLDPNAANHFVLEPVQGVSSPRDGERVGWWSARPRDWTACWPPRRSLPTDASAVRARCSTPSPRRSRVTARTRSRFERHWRSALA